jgi:hypothetical protein
MAVLYIKVKTTHLFILGRGVEYEIVGQIGALGKDGFLEVGFGFGDLGGRGGRGGSDHLLEKPLTERPQVRGAEGGGHAGNLHKQNSSIKQCCGSGSTVSACFWASWIQIRIHSERYGFGSGYFYHYAKIVRKTLISTVF